MVQIYFKPELALSLKTFFPWKVPINLSKKRSQYPFVSPFFIVPILFLKKSSPWRFSSIIQTMDLIERCRLGSPETGPICCIIPESFAPKMENGCLHTKLILLGAPIRYLPPPSLFGRCPFNNGQQRRADRKPNLCAQMWEKFERSLEREKILTLLRDGSGQKPLSKIET